MTRDETSRRIRKALEDHTKDIEPSPHALFSINRRIRDTDRKISWYEKLGKLVELRKHIRPAYVFSAVIILMLGLLSGVLISRNTDQRNTPIQVASEAGDGVALDTVLEVKTPDCRSDVASNDDRENQGYVNVYFQCNNRLVARKRSSASSSIKEALELLLAGPTQAETQLGFTSSLIDAQGDMVKSATLKNGLATVSFATQPETSPEIISQLNTTVLDLENVALVQYKVGEKCADFAKASDSDGTNDKCNSYTKRGIRANVTDHRVVPLKEVPGKRTIYSCIDENSCKACAVNEFSAPCSPEKIGVVESSRIYRYTGEQRTNYEREWIEVATDNGDLGWVEKKRISIQLGNRESQEELNRVALDFSSITAEQALSIKGSFSSVGVKVLSTTPSGAAFARFDIDDSETGENASKIKLVSDILTGATRVEKIPAAETLNNLEYVTLKSPCLQSGKCFSSLSDLGYSTLDSDENELSLSRVNLYFDYRDTLPKIIAISIHYS